MAPSTSRNAGAGATTTRAGKIRAGKRRRFSRLLIWHTGTEIFKLFLVILLIQEVIFGIIFTVQATNKFGFDLSLVLRIFWTIVAYPLYYTIPIALLFATGLVFGRMIADRELYNRTLACQHYWPLIKCPLMFLGATNDFNSPMELVYRGFRSLPERNGSSGTTLMIRGVAVIRAVRFVGRLLLLWM